MSESMLDWDKLQRELYDTCYDGKLRDFSEGEVSRHGAYPHPVLRQDGYASADVFDEEDLSGGSFGGSKMSDESSGVLPEGRDKGFFTRRGGRLGGAWCKHAERLGECKKPTCRRPHSQSTESVEEPKGPFRLKIECRAAKVYIDEGSPVYGGHWYGQN